ncbi:MAG: hypothetical protein IJA36_03950 [Lachnospiraceae bacterium]|nr:hypothetical protein [Lachnospiraceae bacterium]
MSYKEKDILAFQNLGDLCGASEKPIVLMIDEVISGKQKIKEKLAG